MEWLLVIKSRAISAASRLQLPAREQQNNPGSKVKILTEKNLVKNSSLTPVNPEPQNQSSDYVGIPLLTSLRLAYL
jgi:hypothetical protein